MPKSTTRTPSGSSPAQQPLGDLDSEGVVAQEDVADAGDEDARPIHDPSGKPASHVQHADSGSTSSGRKKKRCPGWRSAPRSRPGSSSTVTAR